MWFLKDKIFWGCLFITTISLSLGFGLEGRWVGVLIVLILAALWLSARRNRTSQWLPTGLLILQIGTAITGLVMDCEPFLMINGIAPALGMWDIAQFQRRIKDDEGHTWGKLLDRQHYQSLGLALGCGVLLSNAGLVMRVQLPFGITTLAILISLFGLTRLYSLMKK